MLLLHSVSPVSSHRATAANDCDCFVFPDAVIHWETHYRHLQDIVWYCSQLHNPFRKDYLFIHLFIYLSYLVIYLSIFLKGNESTVHLFYEYVFFFILVQLNIFVKNNTNFNMWNKTDMFYFLKDNYIEFKMWYIINVLIKYGICFFLPLIFLCLSQYFICYDCCF